MSCHKWRIWFTCWLSTPSPVPLPPYFSSTFPYSLLALLNLLTSTSVSTFHSGALLMSRRHFVLKPRVFLPVPEPIEVTASGGKIKAGPPGSSHLDYPCAPLSCPPPGEHWTVDRISFSPRHCFEQCPRWDFQFRVPPTLSATGWHCDTQDLGWKEGVCSWDRDETKYWDSLKAREWKQPEDVFESLYAPHISTYATAWSWQWQAWGDDLARRYLWNLKVTRFEGWR